METGQILVPVALDGSPWEAISSVLQHAIALLPSISITEDVGVISRLTRSCQLCFVVARRCIAALIVLLYHGFQHGMVSIAFSRTFQFVSCLIQQSYFHRFYASSHSLVLH